MNDNTDKPTPVQTAIYISDVHDVTDNRNLHVGDATVNRFNNIPLNVNGAHVYVYRFTAHVCVNSSKHVYVITKHVFLYCILNNIVTQLI
jgi:DNA-binding beta-propeller fold protein YncE